MEWWWRVGGRAARGARRADAARRAPPPLSQLPEYAGQAGLAALFLLTGRWLPGTAHAALAGLHFRHWRRGDASLDVTEIFKQAPAEKRRRAWRLAFYLASFVYVIYRLVEASVHSLLSPEGREMAGKLLQEAASHHV